MIRPTTNESAAAECNVLRLGARMDGRMGARNLVCARSRLGGGRQGAAAAAAAVEAERWRHARRRRRGCSVHGVASGGGEGVAVSE